MRGAGAGYGWFDSARARFEYNHKSLDGAPSFFPVLRPKSFAILKRKRYNPIISEIKKEKITMGSSKSLRKSFTLIEIMIVVAIIALLAAIAIPNLLAARISANESAAKTTVRNLSIAAETFSIRHNSTYPTTVSAGGLQDFIITAPNFCTNTDGVPGAEIQGYRYSCTLTAGGYRFVAAPITLGTTGNVTYTATTGEVFFPL